MIFFDSNIPEKTIIPTTSPTTVAPKIIVELRAKAFGKELNKHKARSAKKRKKGSGQSGLNK